MVSKEKQAEYSRRHYQKNKADRLRRNYEVRERNRAYLIALKQAAPCMDCGVNYPWYVMDYDHVRGIKTCDVGKMALDRLASIKRLQEEIDKCDLVCSNCHRIRTFTRMGR